MQDALRAGKRSGEQKIKSMRWKPKRSEKGATVDTMIIGGLVVDNPYRQKSRAVGIAPAASVNRECEGSRGDDAPQLNRRSGDIATESLSERRGITPKVRSKSTQIIFDQRAVDRREISDRRKKPVSSEPSSEFVAQVVAREGMLLDLRPDPLETRRARTAYEMDQADRPTLAPKRVDFRT